MQHHHELPAATPFVGRQNVLETLRAGLGGIVALFRASGEAKDDVLQVMVERCAGHPLALRLTAATAGQGLP